MLCLFRYFKNNSSPLLLLLKKYCSEKKPNTVKPAMNSQSWATGKVTIQDIVHRRFNGRSRVTPPPSITVPKTAKRTHLDRNTV